MFFEQERKEMMPEAAEDQEKHYTEGEVTEAVVGAAFNQFIYYETLPQ